MPICQRVKTFSILRILTLRFKARWLCKRFGHLNMELKKVFKLLVSSLPLASRAQVF